MILIYYTHTKRTSLSFDYSISKCHRSFILQLINIFVNALRSAIFFSLISMKRKSIRANNDRLLVVIIDRSFDIPPKCVQVLVHILPFSQLRFRRPQGPLLNRPLPSGSKFFFLELKKSSEFLFWVIIPTYEYKST